MMLVLLLLLPLLAGGIAYGVASFAPRAAWWSMFSALLLDVLFLALLWRQGGGDAEGWIAAWSTPWIPALGASFALAVDGMALLLCTLTCGVGLVVLLALRDEPRDNPGVHGLCLMLLLASILGVFLATDLLLFFICFEFMLIPSCALIAWWGTGGRSATALRFFIYTQAGGLLMFIAIAALHVAHYLETGVRTFDYLTLIHTPMNPVLASWLVLGFLAAFLVKMPVVPFHTWQPATYADAPPETSIFLSALMAKTAGFGLLRFVVPLFPDASAAIAPCVLALGAASVLYCSWLAFAQTDLKRLIAYSSAGHLAYVLLAAFSFNDIALKGAIVLMVAHGLSVTGLFLVAWMVESATGTRELGRVSGLWHASPGLGRFALLFAMATLGLPGLANFVGEFLVLLGLFQASPVIAVAAALGTVFSAAYALRILQLVFFGTPKDDDRRITLSPNLVAASAVLVVALLVLGLYPRPVLNRAQIALPPVAQAESPSDGAAAGAR